MTQQNFVKLASQGRAFDATRAWTEEELASLLVLESEGIQRLEAAEYVRNGIRTVAEYKKAVEVGFEPKSLDDMRADAIAANTASVREAIGADEEVSEPEVVAELEAEEETVSEEAVETEADVVGEPEVVAEPEAAIPAAPSGRRGGTNRGASR